MSNTELNKIIEDKYGENGVYVHPDVYPEVEELYLLAPAAVTKEKIADFIKNMIIKVLEMLWILQEI